MNKFISLLPSIIFAYGSIHMSVIGDSGTSVLMILASGICLILNIIDEDKNETRD